MAEIGPGIAGDSNRQTLTNAEAYAKTDADGKAFGDELDRTIWKGAETVGERKIHACLELHIEQGSILEADGIDIWKTLSSKVDCTRCAMNSSTIRKGTDTVIRPTIYCATGLNATV